MENLIPAMFSFLCIGFFALIFLVLGLLMVILNRKNQKKADASQAWPSTTGTLLRADVKQSESVPDEFNQTKPIYYPEIQFEYTVGNQKYYGSRLSFGGAETFATRQAAVDRISSLKPGSVVTVYYDPGNPNNAVLSRVAKKSSLGIIMGVIFLVIGLCGTVSAAGMIIARLIQSQ